MKITIDTEKDFESLRDFVTHLSLDQQKKLVEVLVQQNTMAHFAEAHQRISMKFKENQITQIDIDEAIKAVRQDN